MITAYGETKSANQWSKDKRCLVSAPTLERRIKGGMKPREAMETPPTRTGVAIEVEAWGETKTLSGWARDERCKVDRYTLANRLRGDMEPEQAMTQKVERHDYDFQYLAAEAIAVMSTYGRPGRSILSGANYYIIRFVLDTIPDKGSHDRDQLEAIGVEFDEESRTALLRRKHRGKS